MTRIIILAGEPAVGKSTILRAIMTAIAQSTHLDWTTWRDLSLRGHVLDNGNITILGKYEPDDAFPGTDRLGMNIAPQAIAYLDALRSEASPRVVMFEGDRLLTRNILATAVKPPHVRLVFRISTSPSVLAERRAQRAARVGATQNPGWVQGRATKVHNLLADVPHIELRNDNEADRADITERLVKEALQ